MRGQLTFEYLLIFSAVMVIFAVVTFGQMINPTETVGWDTLSLSKARYAADAIAGAINSVYANGQGAVKSVGLSIDKSWSLRLTENKLTISLEISDTAENVESSLRYGFNGNLQSLPSGAYTVIVEWSGDQENITRNNYNVYIHIKPPMGMGV